MGLWTNMEKKTFDCSSDGPLSGASVAGALVVEISVNHCHSPRSVYLQHRPNRVVEWGCSENHHPYIFKSLVTALISAPPCLCPLLFSKVKAVLVASCLAFLTTVTPITQIMEPVCQQLSVSISVMLSGAGETATAKGSGIHWAHCEMNLS